MSSSVFIIRIQDKQSETAWKVHAEYRGDSTGEKNDIFEFSAEDFRHLNTLSTKDYGIYLGKALFQNDLREFFKSAFHSSQKLMKVTLSIDVEDSSNSDNLRALHWERLCVPMDQSWQYLPLEQRLPFSHHVSTANLDRKYSPIQKDNLKALVLVASPENLETEYNLASFDIEVTVAGIRSAFGDIPCDILANHIEDAIGLPTLKKLIECLTNTNPPYTILHIISHGSVDQRGNTWLYWSNEANQVEPILGGDLIERLCIVQNLPHLIFLCSCSSANYCGGLAQGLIQTLATPTVVAMTDSVTIKTATELAHNFYPRLLKSGEVDVALQQAAAPLAERHDITIPALFSSRLDNQFLFLSPSVKEIVDNSPNSKNNLEERLKKEQYRQAVKQIIYRYDENDRPRISSINQDLRKDMNGLQKKLEISPEEANAIETEVLRNCYREEVEKFIYKDYGDSNRQIHPISREALNESQKKLEISPKEADAIEVEVWKTCLNYEEKLERYKQMLTDIIQKEETLNQKLRGKLKNYQNALGLEDKSVALAYTSLGNYFYKQDKLEAAVTLLKEAINMNTNIAEAYISLGVILYQQGKHKQGISNLKKAEDLLKQQGLTEEAEKIKQFYQKSRHRKIFFLP